MDKKTAVWVAMGAAAVFALLGIAPMMAGDISEGSMLASGFFALLGAICLFVVAPILANQLEKENHAKLLEEGKPVIVQLNVGHYYDDMWVGGTPDSAYGWDVQANIQNIDQKTINYLHIYVCPIDRIGTQIAPDMLLTFTGPLAAKKKTKVSYRHMWYDLPVDAVCIDKIEIVYADGTKRIWGEKPQPKPAPKTAPAAARKLVPTAAVGKPVTLDTPAATLSLEIGHWQTVASGKMWVPNQADANHIWALKYTMNYRGSHPARKIALYIHAFDTSTNEYTEERVFLHEYPFMSGQEYEHTWHPCWTRRPVNHIVVTKSRIYFDDNTVQEIVHQ